VTIPVVLVVVVVCVPPVEELLLELAPPVPALPPLCTPVTVELLDVDELPPLAVAPPAVEVVLREAELPPVLVWPPADDAPPVNSPGLGEANCRRRLQKPKSERLVVELRGRALNSHLSR